LLVEAEADVVEVQVALVDVVIAVVGLVSACDHLGRDALEIDVVDTLLQLEIVVMPYSRFL